MRQLRAGAPDLALYGVQAVGLHGHREPLRRVEAMAAAGAEAISATLPRAPGGVALAGWSFGALVALVTLAIPLGLLFSGVLGTWQSSVWTLGYLATVEDAR